MVPAEGRRDARAERPHRAARRGAGAEPRGRLGRSQPLDQDIHRRIQGDFSAGDYEGRNVHFGIRDTRDGVFVNGLALTDGFIPFGSTFLVFSDYMRPTPRLAALSPCNRCRLHARQPVPRRGRPDSGSSTFPGAAPHPQPHFFRPVPCAPVRRGAGHALHRRKGPTAFALSRQSSRTSRAPTAWDSESMLRGAYTIADADGAPTSCIIVTGSEVELAVSAKKLLDAEGERVRVVSAPARSSSPARTRPTGTARCRRACRASRLSSGVTAPPRRIVR